MKDPRQEFCHGAWDSWPGDLFPSRYRTGRLGLWFHRDYLRVLTSSFSKSSRVFPYRFSTEHLIFADCEAWVA